MIVVIHGDNSDLASIFSCCSKVKNVTEKIDGIFFNAGTMGDCSLDFGALAWSCLKLWQLPYRLATGEGLLRYENRSTKDGTVLLSPTLTVRILLPQFWQVFCLLISSDQIPENENDAGANAERVFLVLPPIFCRHFFRHCLELIRRRF